MASLTVGKKFPVKLTGMLFLRFVGGTLMFIANVENPSRTERNLFQDGAFDAGLYLHESGQAFFVMKFTGDPNSWGPMDVPIHYTQNDERDITALIADCQKLEGQTEKTLPLGLCLVDARTQKIQELRMIGPPPSFFLKLRDIFQMQAAGNVKYDEAYIENHIYTKLTSEDMAKKAQERIFIKRENNEG